MKAIGGYFELADYEKGGLFPHQDGVLLNTGRNALEYILRSIREVKHIYLPYYTCKVVLEPIEKLHIPYTYYHINQQFEIVDDIQPKEGEYIIANNYFGIKDTYIYQLAERYVDHLIVDCAQAFFAKPLKGIKSFYSMRKFVGVADGGIAYTGDLQKNLIAVNEIEPTCEHDSHLFKRKQQGAEAGFADYQVNEKKLDNQPIRLMSFQTKRILDHIDYNKVVIRRRENFKYLHDTLVELNCLTLPEMNCFVCPMVYPIIINTEQNLRKKLIDRKIFVAKYWPNVDNKKGFETEENMAKNVIPIPCDHRYVEKDIQRIIKTIKTIK